MLFGTILFTLFATLIVVSCCSNVSYLFDQKKMTLSGSKWAFLILLVTIYPMVGGWCFSERHTVL